MTSLLEQILARQEKWLGKDNPAVQMLRDQIHAQGTGKSAGELYITGSVKKPKEPPPSKGDD